MACESQSATRWLRVGLVVLRALSPFALGLALSGPRPAIVLGALTGLAGLALRRPYGGLALGLLLELLVWSGSGLGGHLVAVGLWLAWLPRPKYHLLAAGAFLAAGGSHYLEWSFGAAAVTLLGAGVVTLSKRRRRSLCGVSMG